MVGRTGCKKITFIQNLGRNKIFSDIKEYQTISKISLSTERENNISDCFKKSSLTYVYIFHKIYPRRQDWQMILSHRKIFNIFLGSVQTSFVIGIISSFCRRYKCT